MKSLMISLQVLLVLLQSAAAKPKFYRKFPRSCQLGSIQEDSKAEIVEISYHMTAKQAPVWDLTDTNEGGVLIWLGLSQTYDTGGIIQPSAEKRFENTCHAKTGEWCLMESVFVGEEVPQLESPAVPWNGRTVFVKSRMVAAKKHWEMTISETSGQRLTNMTVPINAMTRGMKALLANVELMDGWEPSILGHTYSDVKITLSSPDKTFLKPFSDEDCSVQNVLSSADGAIWRIGSIFMRSSAAGGVRDPHKTATN
ncbi:hypothetical protein BCR37DRAFT_101428 [Protomyces lactucae-debilis]|uniref:Concanavalin A-like lectin/glucanase domain-containing protein n=1 Tax=Protomyces lactucae-debilis TaxID=2754530 RepID=A0A1Y2F6C6_PROLT|nr:uncharacterized protein BCR37DRAFT_101428 [Protomyces lactucae-debilis]ORY79034.1 hypothetical protein BCR37DRAFT_101428 [Protomyces lactucae-debilis]